MIRTVGFLYDQIPCSSTRNFNLGLESLALRRKKFDLIMSCKIFSGHSGIKALFQLRASNTREESKKLYIKTAKRSVRRDFFVIRAAVEFETLMKDY